MTKTAYKRFSETELNQLREKVFQGNCNSVDPEDIQRLLNERDILDHALRLTADANRQRSELLTAFEIMSEQKAENARLRERLAKYESDVLEAAV